MTTTQRDLRTPPPATTPADATVTLLPTAEGTDLALALDHDHDHDHDPKLAARAALKSRHSQSLTKLLTERDDLRGVHALADFVHDSVRWTA